MPEFPAWMRRIQEQQEQNGDGTPYADKRYNRVGYVQDEGGRMYPVHEVPAGEQGDGRLVFVRIAGLRRYFRDSKDAEAFLRGGKL